MMNAESLSWVHRLDSTSLFLGLASRVPDTGIVAPPVRPVTLVTDAYSLAVFT